MTPIFWVLVVAIVLLTAGTIAYIKLKIEPVTEEWARFLEMIRVWRTQGFAAAVAILGFAEVVDPGAIVAIFGPDSKGWVTVIIGGCIYLLRLVTGEPQGGVRRGPPGKR